MEIGKKEHSGTGMGDQHTGFGSQGGEQVFNLFGIGVLERNDLGDDLIFSRRQLTLTQGGDVFRSRHHRGNNLDDRTARNGCKTMDLQHRLKNPIGVLLGDAGW